MNPTAVNPDPFVDDGEQEGKLGGRVPGHCELVDVRKISGDAQKIVAAARRMRIEPREFILALIESFPCLVGKWDGPWDVDRFIKRSGPWSTGEKYAAKFVACVWNPHYAEQKRWRFNVSLALGTWDRGNREAFLNWAANPYWP